ncbi:MAG TPA: YafY family protein [Acidimicrobiales bacterium]
MWDTSARLLRLLSLLQVRHEWPGRELAARLGVDVRTVRRDVDRLRSLGYPVHSTPGAAGGYRLEPGTDLPPLLLDDDEAVAIAVGLRTAAGATVAGIDDASQRALAKLERVLPARLRGRVAALSAATVPLTGPRPVVDADDLSAIATACRDHETLRFDYRRNDGNTARRTVEPLRLVHTGRLWYLVAWDVARRGWRTFRVDRIGGRPVPIARFTPRPPPADDIAAFVSRGTAVEAYPVSGRVTVHAPLDAVAERISPTAGLLEAVDADSCVLRTGARTLDNLAYHLVTMGLDFTVDEPPELVDHIRAIARRLDRASCPAGGAGGDPRPSAAARPPAH